METSHGPGATAANRLLEVDRILARHNYRRSALIAVLQDIQELYHYLPEDASNYVATALQSSPANVFAVATFYAQFSLEPKGKYLVRVCDGTACHIKNSQKVYDMLAGKLKLRDGRMTTADGLFTLETVACLGACGIAPVMVINDVIHPQLTPEAAAAIVEALVRRAVDPLAAGPQPAEERPR